MDTVDYQILEILKNKGRASHEAIAQEVSLSRPAVRNRILAMEENGIISGYSVDINYNQLGYQIHVLVYVKVNGTAYRQIVEKLASATNRDIRLASWYNVSGEWCLLLRVMSKTQDALTKYIDTLLSFEEVEATNTVLLFKSERTTQHL